MKILNSYWFSPMGNKLIGIVKVLSSDDKRIKYYIGTGTGHDKGVDERHIANCGARFPESAGTTLFDEEW